jgi:tetratricopeptide (TPR) repeat protein
MRRSILSALLAATALPAAAQHVHDVPPRPPLFAAADTNSAGAYYLHGVQLLTREPRTAAAAFYWAERLQPGWADALYGRRVALLMSEPRRLVRYMTGDRGVVRSRDVLAIDSLYLRALMAEPFMLPKLDRQMFEAFVHAAFSQGTTNAALANFEARTWLNDASPAMKAWFAYSQGRFGDALGDYERAVRRASRDERPRTRTDLARVQYFLGSYEPAIQNLTQALQEFRVRDAGDLVFVYESKALLEQSLGAIHEARGDSAAAREAYGRALQEDLAYAPAHLRLAALAQGSGDIATALGEYALAVELAPGEATVRYRYGVALAAAGQAVEAVAQFNRAIEMEPYYAAPHYALGIMNFQAQLHEDAITHMEAFLARAAREDPLRANATAALTQSRAALATPSGS